MVFHGLPIKHGGSFHGYVSHNQMVNQDEIHGMVRGSDPRQNIQNANLERALTALTNKMGTFGKTLCGGEHGAFSIEKFAGSAWGNNWHNQCISRLWSCLSLHGFVRNLQYINAINPTLPFCQAPWFQGTHSRLYARMVSGWSCGFL